MCGDALTTANSTRINTLAMSARLPTIYPDRLFLEAGGFMAYGANNWIYFDGRLTMSIRFCGGRSLPSSQ